MAVIQYAPSLNSGLLPNFWWLRSINCMKFTEGCMMCIEKPVFNKKNIYKWVKTWVCHYEPESKRQSMEWKH